MSSETPWISVGELAQGFGVHGRVAQTSGDLAGRTMRLHLENDWVFEASFETEDRLRWTRTGGEVTGTSLPEEPVQEAYRAVEVRDGIYFVDFVEHMKRASSVSMVLDLDRQISTVVLGELPVETEARSDLLSRLGSGVDLTAVRAKFLSGSIDAAFCPDTPRHGPTRDLIGRRVEYSYSPTEAYEHIYLNENLYTWHCVAGVEQGLADTDRCHYYRLGEELYLFVWREKLIPTLGVVTLDYEAGRSNGKIFGYTGSDFDSITNFPVGSIARLLNTTLRDAGSS